MISIELVPTNLMFQYTNHRGETATRRVVARRLFYGVSDYYPGHPPQWYIEGFDNDRNATRLFRAAAMVSVEG